jgi:hypothetical protein
VLFKISEEGVESPYTGLFETGADFGILRMSESLFLAKDAMDNQRFSPSVAIKFLVDGAKSVNLMTQVSFGGVEEDYFFENDFTTQPPRSTNQCMRDTIEKKFAEASMFPFSTATGHIACVKQNGTVIPDDDSFFPYEIVLVPNRELFPKENMVDGEDMLDFFSNWEPTRRENGSIEAVTLFDVQARHDPGVTDLL